MTSTTTMQGRIDCSSDEGLREGIAGIATDGWDGAAGRAVLDAVRQRCPAWARSMDRRSGRRPGTTDERDVLAAAWSTLHRFPHQVGRAQAPWAYLWISVAHVASMDNSADSLLSRTTRPAGGIAAGLPTAVRVGLNYHLLDLNAPDGRIGTESCGVMDSWSPALRAVLDELVRSGGCRAYWADALDRAVDVMASARRSYEEHALRRDPYLRLVLGLGPDQLSALGALLIGPRRGDRARQSLLLALHRDPTTPAEQVPGALHRIDVLLRSQPANPATRAETAA